jgi:hypothetical protein
MKRLNFISGVIAALLFSANALALPFDTPITTLTFQTVTNNNPGNVTVGQTQISVQMFDSVGGNSLTDTGVIFRFLNSGPATSTITQIYFEDGTLLGAPSFSYPTLGVAYETGANPANLPGGNNAAPAFVATQIFNSQPTPNVQSGVDPLESLDVRFALLAGKDTGDTLFELSNLAGFGEAPGGLRIGIHVQRLPTGGGSEGFVNNLPIVPDPTVPEPTPVWMLGLGLLGLGGYKRRQTKLAA